MSIDIKNLKSSDQAAAAVSRDDLKAMADRAAGPGTRLRTALYELVDSTLNLTDDGVNLLNVGALNVAGRLDAKGEATLGSTLTVEGLVTANAGLTVEGTLVVSRQSSEPGKVVLNDKPIQLRGATDVTHGLGYATQDADNGKYGKMFAGRNWDGPALYGYSAGVLGTTQGEQKVALSWDVLGTITAHAGHTVNGDLVAKQTLTVDGALMAKQTLTVDGALMAKQTLTVDGALMAKQTLTVDGALMAKQTLTVDGDLTAKQTLTVEGALAAKKTLTVEGNLVLNNQTIQLRNPDDQHHGLRYVQEFAGQKSLDGPALYGNTSGVLGTTQDVEGKLKEKIALSWDASAVTVEGNLELKGYLKSPMWKVTQLVSNRTGALPQVSGFEAHGGTLVVFASGSGRRRQDSVKQPIGMKILLVYIMGNRQIEEQIGIAQCWSDEPDVHTPFVASLLVKSGTGAGPHAVLLDNINEFTITDHNDYFSVTILELPF
jgi:cytoskeletal protein CcmA (bactofilin family)